MKFLIKQHWGNIHRCKTIINIFYFVSLFHTLRNFLVEKKSLSKVSELSKIAFRTYSPFTRSSHFSYGKSQCTTFTWHSLAGKLRIQKVSKSFLYCSMSLLPLFEFLTKWSYFPSKLHSLAKWITVWGYYMCRSQHSRVRTDAGIHFNMF